MCWPHKTHMSGIFTLLALLYVLQLVDGDSLRIIGGRNAYPDEYPYVVNLATEYEVNRRNRTTIIIRHTCSGSVILPTWTVTACHCVPLHEASTTIGQRYLIRYGSPSGELSTEDRYSTILEFVWHPTYGMKLSPDVALLRSEPILLKRYARISAIDYNALYGQEVVVAGYGLTNASDGKLKTTHFLKKPLQVIEKAMVMKCDGREGLESPIVCIVHKCGQTATASPGDSGGPVLHPSGIIGISVSGHLNNMQMKNDRIRTNVICKAPPLSMYIDWIYDMTSRNKY